MVFGRKKRSKSKSGKSAAKRDLVECSPHRITGGGFFQGLSVGHIEHESHIERYALSTLLLCHDVYRIESQVGKEPYSLDGQQKHHIPDFVADTFVEGLRLEVKALAQLARPETLRKYSAVAKGYLTRGVPFALLVDAQLEEAPRFRSVKLLARYVTSQIPDQVAEKARIALASGAKSIGEIKACAGLQLVDIWTLIAQRHLCFDWDKPLHAEESPVSLPGQPYEGLKLENILRSTRFGGFLAELALGRQPTDKQLLADASTWRQHDRPIGPWNFVGGFQRAPLLRDIGDAERILREADGRRDFGSGQSAWPTRSTKR